MAEPTNARPTDAHPSDTELDQMQDEAMALLTAWVDRGVPPELGAVALAGFSHAAMKALGAKQELALEMITRAWA